MPTMTSDEELVREWLVQNRAVLIIPGAGHPTFAAILLQEAPKIASDRVMDVEHNDCPQEAVRALLRRAFGG